MPLADLEEAGLRAGLFSVVVGPAARSVMLRRYTRAAGPGDSLTDSWPHDARIRARRTFG